MRLNLRGKVKLWSFCLVAPCFVKKMNSSIIEIPVNNEVIELDFSKKKIIAESAQFILQVLKDEHLSLSYFLKLAVNPQNLISFH